MTNAVVQRLHECLVDAIRERRPDAAERPLTVAEVYQDLVPYRAVRDALGIGLNADYEHALMRLFAGDGDRVRVEPAEAREELRSELDSPNPNVGLFRKFAACDVHVELPPDAEGPPAGGPGAQDSRPGGNRRTAAPAPDADGAPGVAPARDEPAEPGEHPAQRAHPGQPAQPGQPASASSPAQPGGQAPAADPLPRVCAFCGEGLPAGREIGFCPYCGERQDHVPCRECGEPLDPDWRYCVACGAAAAAPGGGG